MADITDDKGYNQIWEKNEAVRVRTAGRCGRIINAMDRQSGATVLEIGCGTGEISAMMAAGTKNMITGMDMCAPFIENAGKTFKLPNLEFITADFNEAGGRPEILKNRKFDYVVGNGILHHLYGTIGESLKNIYNLLNSGGKMIFWEPNLLNPYCFLIFNFGFFRKAAKLDPAEMAFTNKFIEKQLSRTGFTSIKVEYRDFLVPGTPDFIIKPVVAAGWVLEKIPVINIMAQSLFISASKNV